MLLGAWKAALLAVSLAVRTLALQSLADDTPSNASATLFCFALVVPFGYEASLLASQQKESVGVFGCDGHTVFSNVSGAQLFGRQAASIHSSVISMPLEVPRWGSSNGYLNTGVFIKVWDRLFKEGQYSKYDWTLKVDVDTIVVPELLRGLLLIHCEPQDCRPMYLQDSRDALHGPIEVLSKAAVKYFSVNMQLCVDSLDYSDKNEAQFLDLCLRSLAVAAAPEPNLLLQVRPGVSCGNMYAAFHPFKSWESSLQCLEEAGLRLFREPPKVDLELVGPSLLCIALVMPTYEAVLVSQQYLAGVGIFSCESYMLFSNVSSQELFRPGYRPSRWPSHGPEVARISGNLQMPWSSKYSTPLNAAVFIKVWDRVFKDGRYKEYDWTLKLAHDAVFLPGRLRELLWSACPLQQSSCGPMFVQNGGPIHGPVEVFSRRAVERFAGGADLCKKSLDYSDEGENAFILQCMGQLEIEAVQLPELLAGPGVSGSPACTPRHAVFHPFGEWDPYMGCMAEAGYILPGPADARDRWEVSDDAPRAPSLFCWALVLPSGPEPRLLLRQRQAGVGIFSCDSHLVISNTSLSVTFGDAATGLDMAIIGMDLFAPIGGRYRTALNSPVFIRAWRAVFRDGRAGRHDWTLKVDTDAVFIPQRVRRLLSRHCGGAGHQCGARYLFNFGEDLHGPVEALTRGAVEVFARGERRCAAEVDYAEKGEDWYLDLCLGLLGILGEEEPTLLSDWHLDQGLPTPCDTMHAAFHPFKTWDSYFRCLCQTGYATAACAVAMLPTTTSSTSTGTTRTTLTSTHVAPSSMTTTTGTGTTTTTTTTSTQGWAPSWNFWARVVGALEPGGEARDGGRGGGNTSDGPRLGSLGSRISHSFPKFDGLKALELGAVGVSIGISIGLLVSFVSRKMRASSIANPPHTSVSEPPDVRMLERLTPGSPKVTQAESGSSYEQLLVGGCAGRVRV